MKRAKRFTAFFTALVMGAAVLSGCGQESPDVGSGTSESSGTSAVQTSSSGTEVSRTEQITRTEQTEQTDSEVTIPLADILTGEEDTGDVTEARADKMKGDYISPDTTFTLTAKEDISAEDMSRMIALSPDIPFEVERTRERTYVLRLGENIPDNRILKLTVKNGRSWAFQTADTFRITGTFPADGSSGAPINSGVEMTLSMAADISTAEDNFTISPSVPGRFELHNKTLVFVPKENFDLKTVYTVTVGKGLSAESGDSLGENFTFSFKTTENTDGAYCYTSRGVSETFLPGDIVLTEIYASDSIRNGSFDVKLYKYPSGAEYEKALTEAAGQLQSSFVGDADITIAPSPDMEEVWSDNVKLQLSPLDDSRWKPGYLIFPEGLESGCYLVNIRAGQFAIDRLIQISDISLYASVIPGSTAFFVNDAASGEAAKGAKITVADNGSLMSAVADDKGIALMVMDTPQDKRRKGVIKAEYDGRTFYDLIPLDSVWEHDLKEDYFVYLYTDRNAYLSTDTVSVWGTIMPRDSSVTKLPGDLSLTVHYYASDGESVPVTLSADGTFTAKVPIDSAGEGWYNITLYSGDSELTTEYIQVKDYVKPAYTLIPEGPEVVFMAHENPFEVTLDAAYYDGTAAAGLTFSVSGATASTAVTDDGGHISVTVQPELNTEAKNPRPSYESVSFEMSGVEDEYQSTYLSYINIDRDVYVSYKQEGDRLDITANLIDPEKVTPENRYDPEEYLGAPADVTVALSLEKSWTEETQVGTYYDFLLKRTEKKYKYDYKTEKAGSFSVKTQGGKAVIEGIEFDDKSSYRGTFSWLDTRGHKCECSVYLTNPNRSGSSYDRRTDYKYYTLMADKNRFKENETLHFDLMNNAAKAEENAEGRIFYAFSQTEFLRTETASGISFDCVMTNDLVPNIHVSGAYFDGRHIYPIKSVGYYEWEYDYYDYGYSDLVFDPADRELTLSVSSDRDSYSPGDDVEVTVLVRDKEGRAAANAPVNLSVVDEAAFAVAPQNPMPLSALYQSLYFPWPTDYYTYNQYALLETGGGEKGGGGDDYTIRKDFKDNAAFMTSTTDSSGRAVFKFKSPDNITTWRATAHSVDRRENGVYAGVTKEPVIVSLPFFITPVAPNAFLEGDDVSFAAKTTAGNADITVTVKGDDYEQTVTVPEISAAMFGKLPMGDYTVTFTASDGKNTDGVELPFKVTDTLLETGIVRRFDLSEDKFEISPLRFPVKLNFYDMEYSAAVSALSKLGCLWGDRVDYKIARAYSAMSCGYITREEYEKQFSYLKSRQLISLWSYAEGDPKLTALMAAAAPEFISTGAADAFRDILYNESSTSEEVSSAYLGLAALGEPVLVDMNKVMEDPVGFDDTDMLRFAAAYGLLGDRDRGSEIFAEAAEKIMTGYTGRDGTLILRTDSEYNDLAALMAASVLKLEHADMLAERVVRDIQTEESSAAYLMVYLENFTPKAHETGEDATVKITAGGKTEEIAIPAFGRKTVTLSKAQCEAEDFAVELANGKVQCVACYEGRMTDNREEPSLKVVKKIESVTGGYAPGDMLRVTIDVGGMTGNYKSAAVDDVIPTGARFVRSGNDCYVSRSGQRVSGYVSHESYVDRRMIYYIRLATPGEFVVESAVARQGDNWGYSERSSVTVTEASGNA